MYVNAVANEQSHYVNVKIDFLPREYVNLRKTLREYVNFGLTGGASFIVPAVMRLLAHPSINEGKTL